MIAESSNYVMLGFMGDDPHETVASMRSWQQACYLVITPSSRQHALVAAAADPLALTLALAFACNPTHA